MSYVVGVDVGTTFSAAATGTADRVEVFDLGTRSAAIPSVVVLRADGTVLVGEAAERRAVSEPSRTAREFKRRLGDPTPFLLGGTPYGAEALTGHLLADVITKVGDQLGEPPRRVVLTHPANYGDYKLGYLEEAARLAGVGEVEFVPEPVAAAAHYAWSERLATGELLAVYDFGGGTLDLAMVRATVDGFDLVGTPEGMERFGGVDLDETVFFHVTESLGDAMTGLDPADPATMAALSALRASCRDAKEALSADIDTTIPVMLPTAHTEVRLTRAEFEDMLRPRLRETMTVLQRVVESAGAAYQDVARILLVGGASRIPLVAEMIRQETGRPVAVDTNPKHAVCMGAARLGLRADESAAEPEVIPADLPDDTAGAGGTDEPAAAEPPPGAADEPVPETPHAGAGRELPPTDAAEPIEASRPEPPATAVAERSDLESAGRSGRRWVWPVLAVVVIAVIGAIVVISGVFGGGDDSATDPAGADAEPPPLGLLYSTQYRTAEADGEWGRWGVIEAEPPADIAADFYPELGPYSSTDPGVLGQHMAWVEQTGADLLVVTWNGAAFDRDELFVSVLDAAEEAGIAVVPLIESYPDRSPESVVGEIEHLTERFGEHPAWFRSHRRTPWVDETGRPVVIVVAPEIVNDLPELGPDDWAATADAARDRGVVTLAVANDPGWVEVGRFDGLASSAEGTGFGWASALPEHAWFVPSVIPGRSLERVGEPEATRERDEGVTYEQEWMGIADADRAPDMVVVVSFNSWLDGTQIEPATATSPDPRYRTYEPLEPGGYLELTREFAERFLTPGG